MNEVFACINFALLCVVLWQVGALRDAVGAVVRRADWLTDRTDKIGVQMTSAHNMLAQREKREQAARDAAELAMPAQRTVDGATIILTKTPAKKPTKKATARARK